MHSAGGKALDDASHFPALVSFIMVDSTTVLQCLKIDLREIRGISVLVPTWRMTCPSPPFMILCFLYLPFRHFLIAAYVFLLISASDPSSSLAFFTQLPFGEELFHFYPQDTSKRRSKRSARSRQRLQKDRRVSIHADMHTEEHMYACAL